MFGALRVHVAYFPQIVLFVEAAFDFLEAAFFLQLLQFFLQLLNLLGSGFLVAFEINSLGKIELGQNFGHTFVAQAFVDLIEQFEIFVEDVHEARQIRAFQLGRAFAVTHDQAVGSALDQDFHVFAVVFDVLLRLALLDRVQRRLRNEYVSALDQFLHVAEEERQQQRTDVASIHVGIGHENDFAVAQFARVEIFFRNAGAQRGNHGANFFVREHLVVAGFFDVKDFAFQRQDGLETPVASLLRGAACGFAFDQEQFATLGLLLRTIGEFAGKASAVECALAAGQVASFASGFTRAGCVDRFVDDLSSDGRILLEIRAQAFVDERLHHACNVGIQLALSSGLQTEAAAA